MGEIPPVTLRQRLLPSAAVSWTLADQILVSGSNFATSVIVARGLGAAGFGVFALSWIVVLFGQSILAAAFSQPVMSLGPKQAPDQVERYYASSFALQVIGAAVAAIVLVGAALVTQATGQFLELQPLLYPLAVCIFVAQVQDYLRRYAFTRSAVRRAFAADLARYATQLLGLVLLFVLAGFAGTVSSTIWIISASALIGCLPFVGALPLASIGRSDVLAALRQNLVFSRWLVGAALLQWLTTNFFLIVSGALLGPAATGVLRAGQTLLGTLHVVFQAADNIVPPRAARLHRDGGNAAVFALVKRLLLLGVTLTALVAVFLALPGDFWMVLLFGHDFGGTGLVVAAYGATYVLIATTIPLRYGFYATEKTNAIFLSYLIAAAFNLVVAWPIVSTFGQLGALAGIVLVQAVLLSAMAVQYLAIVRRS
jgi:O-antigen/teichoic acid export membrane protein